MDIPKMFKGRISFTSNILLGTSMGYNTDMAVLVGNEINKWEKAFETRERWNGHHRKCNNMFEHHFMFHVITEIYLS